MSNQAADNMILAILNIGRDRMVAGNYDEAVSFLTNTIEAVEAKRETYSGYGIRLMPVYALRALTLHKCAQLGSGDVTLRRAQQDVLKAQGVLDEFGVSLPAGMLESLRARVEGVLSGDDGIVAASMAGLRGEEDGAFMAVRDRPVQGARWRRPAFSITGLWYLHVIALLIGAAGWAIAGLTFSAGGVGQWIGAALFFLMIGLTLGGCDWMSQYGSGTVGELIKFMALAFLACTMIGMIPISYWAGKKVLRWTNVL
jgi:hypothetical protein